MAYYLDSTRPDPTGLFNRALKSPCFGHDHRLICKSTEPPILERLSEIAGNGRFQVFFDRYGVAVHCQRSPILAYRFGPISPTQVPRCFAEEMILHEIRYLVARCDRRIKLSQQESDWSVMFQWRTVEKAHRMKAAIDFAVSAQCQCGQTYHGSILLDN